MTAAPDLALLRASHRRIAPQVHRTPVLTSRLVDEQVGATVFFKCENLQRTGAFKIRGASNAVMSLDAPQCAHGVATHSSGNHGAALARAAALRGMAAYIVMPESASQIKIEAVRAYGAHIVYCSSEVADRQRVLERVLAQTGARLVHPFNDHTVIAGQASAALELVEQAPELDLVLAPVGGGGLLAGSALAVHHTSPGTRVVGVEPRNVDDACRSYQAGRIIALESGRSIADGLLTTVGEKPFAIMRRHVHDMVAVEEAQIVAAMRFLWTRMKILIEPSAAVPVAALLNGYPDAAARRIGVILSGGNVDLDRLPWASDGRRDG